jgi:hypothetical protein
MDFSLTTVVVVPAGEVPKVTLSTQDLLAGEVGFYGPDYVAATAANVVNDKYFYVAQGRDNTYLQGTKRSNRIAGSLMAGHDNVTEYYKITGHSTALNQITTVDAFTVQCGESVTMTLRGHSSYLDTLYFNGFTRSVTIEAPCCDCGVDPCLDVDVTALVADLLAKLTSQGTDAVNGDNIKLTDFYDFAIVNPGVGDATEGITITGKPVNKYGQPCDIAAYPHEYDRLWFNTFVYEGPATTADFLVYDDCTQVATVTEGQRSVYPTGTSEEIAQLEKNFYSYQAGYLKHLFRMAGYNQNFDSLVVAGQVYDTFYVKFNTLDRSAYQWGDYIPEDSTVIIAAITGSAESTAIEAFLDAALGAVTIAP